MEMAENKSLGDIFEAISRLTDAVMKGVNASPPPPPPPQNWRGGMRGEEEERSGGGGRARGAGGGGREIEARLSMLVKP